MCGIFAYMWKKYKYYDLLENFIKTYRRGPDNCKLMNINKHVQNSLMLVTALNKSIGYDTAAKIAKKAYENNISLKAAALKLKLIDEKKFDKLVDPKKMI